MKLYLPWFCHHCIVQTKWIPGLYPRVWEESDVLNILHVLSKSILIIL